MEINKLSDLYNLKDKDNNTQKTLPSNSTGSIFSLLNNCIEKADTSGDGVLSEEEISIFMTSGYNEAITDFQEEFEGEIDASFISQIKNMVSTMLQSSEEIEESVSSLDGMKKDDFLNNVKNAKNNEDASMFWKMMGMDDAEGIFNNLDTDKNGSISAEEIEKIATLDNNKNNISLEDLGNFFNKQEETSSIENTEETEIEGAKTVQQARSSGFSGSQTNSSFTQPKTETQKENRTVDVINKEITDQETLKEETKEKAVTAIKEQDEKIAEALEQSNLSDAFKEEYNEENKRLETAIKEKDDELNKENSLAQDYKAEAENYKTSIANIDAQISSMESAMSNLSESETDTKKSEYKSKIENLKAKKQEYINAQNKAEENEKLSNERIKKLEQEKQELTTEKGNILNTLSEKYPNEKEQILTFKEKISEFETEKNEIQTKLEGALNKIDTKIQELKNEKVQLEQKQETQKFLDENKVVADTTPIGINGDISTFTIEDWKKLGYNETNGNNLGDEARIVATQMGNAGSKGNCLGGVKRAFIAATGSSPFGNPEEGITVASKCITVMEENENFREVTGIGKGDLQYLPAGAVVVWSSSTTGNSAASKYGHISISLGDGNEASDRLHAQYYGVGENGKPRVFIPV